jgi:hypothetical protein
VGSEHRWAWGSLEKEGNRGKTARGCGRAHLLARAGGAWESGKMMTEREGALPVG